MFWAEIWKNEMIQFRNFQTSRIQLSVRLSKKILLWKERKKEKKIASFVWIVFAFLVLENVWFTILLNIVNKSIVANIYHNRPYILTKIIRSCTMTIRNPLLPNTYRIAREQILAATWENIPSVMCAQRRRKLACASAQSDQSLLFAWRNFASLAIQSAPSEDSNHAGCFESSLGAHHHVNMPI